MGYHFPHPYQPAPDAAEPATMADIRRELEALLAQADRTSGLGSPGAPQTARSIGMGRAWVDLADVVDLASLAEGRRRHAYRMAADAVDHLIALMDALEADTEDMEPDTDAEGYADDDDDTSDQEPSLGAPENHPGRYHVDMDGREHFSRGKRQLGDQTAWARGGDDDREDETSDLEPEAGYDLPEGDDERDGSEHDGSEQPLGWAANVSQLRLHGDYEVSGEAEHTAPERAGRGFLRSGPDDSEDSDPAEDDGTAEPGEGAWEGNRDQGRWCDMVTPPRFYAMRAEGVCLEPVIPDGSLCTMDSEAPFAPGDFVVVHHDDPNAEAGIASKVKLLAHDLPWTTFPVVSDAELLPVISVRMLNPPRGLMYDPTKVHAVHKVVKVERPDAR